MRHESESKEDVTDSSIQGNRNRQFGDAKLTGIGHLGQQDVADIGALWGGKRLDERRTSPLVPRN